MNLPALTRKWFRPASRASSSSHLQSVNRLRPAIEPMEARIAPATLVSPTQISFLDKNGEIATVTISKPLFTTANVNKAFTFDTGSVNGDNTVEQQLELFNVTKLGHGAGELNITIAGISDAVDVGYINAAGIDLGTVSIGGDLGRIHAGLAGTGHSAITSLTINSLGADGTSTQAAGGNLVSLFSGPVPTITINGNIDQADIGVGGGPLGAIGSLTVTGSVIGGAAEFSGSVRTQGGLDTVLIDGSIEGGAGASSGVIGTAGQIHSITVEGALTGGSGKYSGSILATGSIAYAQIDGDVTGGTGTDSGEIGSANTLQTVVVNSSVEGGSGTLSGVILAARSIGTVTITNGLVGGNGNSSGVIGAGVNIGSVTIGSSGLPTPIVSGVHPLDGTYQGMEEGNGSYSGSIHAGGNIGSVTIGGSIEGTYTIEEDSVVPHGIHPFTNGNGSFYGNGDGAGVISAGGAITSVYVTGFVDDGGIVSGTNIGTVTIVGSLTDFSGIHAHGGITTVSVNASGPSVTLARQGAHPQPSFTPGSGFGIDNSAILADIGGIGQILAGGTNCPAIYFADIAAGGTIGLIQAQASGTYESAIEYTDVYAGSLSGVSATSAQYDGIAYSTFVVTHNIGYIDGYNNGNSDGDGSGIIGSIFQAGGSIGSIGASSQSDDPAIGSSGFNAGGNIGAISTTGAISASTFVAGINLGSNFNNSTTGTFTNTDAANIGYSHTVPSSVAASIGSITLVEGETGSAVIENSTFLAGVRGAGIDKQWGTKDDLVPVGSRIGTISAPDGIVTNFFESGSIGATTSGPIFGTTYIATDSAVSAPGIGALTVVVNLPDSDNIVGLKAVARPLDSGFTGTEGIASSSFISNAGIGNINVTLNGYRSPDDNSGIAASTFAAGHAIGTITVINNVYGTDGDAYGITASTFTAGVGGYGGVGDINISLTDDGNDGNTAGINETTIDGSYCSCMSASMGSIYVSNADSSETAAGIVDSTFRTHGNIGAITSLLAEGSDSQPAIQGSVFSAYGSIGDITTTGSILADEGGPSQFLAGYDIGTGMTFGGQDLSVHSLALHAGQSVGNVSVSGNFEGSDIIASINPGAGYVFGADTNTNVGAGGTIGTVTIGSALESDGSPFISDSAQSHAIEAANFPITEGGPYVTAYGYLGFVPVVLDNGDFGNVRITNLTPSDS